MSKGPKKRKKRHAFLSFLGTVVSIALFLAILGVLAYYFCPLQEVAVEGTDLYSDEEIKNYILDDEYSTNTIYVYVKNLIFPKGDAEFIDSFDVKITGLNSVTIVCNEKTILGYLMSEDGKYVYFNYDGIIVEISDSFIDRGYMQVDGVIGDEIEVGDSLSVADGGIGYLTSLIKILQKNNLLPNVISYDERGHITLKYDTYNISLGSGTYLEEKIDRAIIILPQIEGMYGTLHIENYSNQNTDIVFEKDSDTGD